MRKKRRADVNPASHYQELYNKNYILITRKAEAIYSEHPKKADKTNSIKSIIKLFNKGVTPETLLKCVCNYKAEIKRRGIDRDYWIQSNNFFGKAARYEEYIDPKQEEEQVGPHGGFICRGCGKETHGIDMRGRCDECREREIESRG